MGLFVPSQYTIRVSPLSAAHKTDTFILHSLVDCTVYVLSLVRELFQAGLDA